jgi:hypothetical protein
MKNIRDFYELEVRNRSRHKLDALIESKNFCLKVIKTYESYIKFEDDFLEATKYIRRKK